MVAFELFIVIAASLILGSFATALTYRVPRGISWVWPRSSCPSCQKPLSFPDLVPVFSWLFLKGKCRHCAAPIGRQYLYIEIGVLALALVGYAFLGFGMALLWLMLTLPFLVALLVIDLQRMILPDQLVLMLGLIGLARIGFLVQDLPLDMLLQNYLLGAVLFGALAWGLERLMTRMLKREAMGFGDVKFFAISGLWLGLENIGLFCILGGACGVLFALLWRRISGERQFPFGPALIATFYLILLLQGSLLP